VDVSGSKGAERLIAQPKLLTLTVYLMLSRRRGFQSRERLLAAFWPDQLEDRARSSLRSALYTLRDLLGVEIIQRRGDDLSVDPARFTCDAYDFADAIRNDGLAHALELYRGQVLEGFYPETAELQHWLDEEREHYRGLAADAAWSLAERYESGANDLTSAARWARRAARLARADERRIRRVMSLLERAGDTAGAMAVYEEFVRFLERELEIQPSEETASLARSIRERRAS
jgi:DNA-binding SARP family transcriptional activator